MALGTSLKNKHVELIRLNRVSCESNMFVYYLCAYQNQGKTSFLTMTIYLRVLPLSLEHDDTI